MKVDRGVMDEVKSCIGIVENIKEELCREKLYNRRKGFGNISAPELFQTIWDGWCSFSGLCSWALDLGACTIDDVKIIGLGSSEKVIVVAINQVEALVRRNPTGQEEAKVHIVEMCDKVSVLCEKLSHRIDGG